MLTAKVNELEVDVQSLRRAQQSFGPTSLYQDELQSLVSSSSMLSDGPINMESLQSFSLASIISDVRHVAPSFYSLLCDLGDVRRNAKETDTLTQNEIGLPMCSCQRKV